MLQRANASVKETRSLMQYGRGNVRTDIQATDNLSTRLAEATRLAPVTGRGGLLTTAQDAGVTAYAGAGNCGDFASVGFHVHASRLRPDETLQQAKNTGVDHVFAIHSQPNSSREMRLATAPIQVLLDPWGVDPAVNLADTKMGKKRLEYKGDHRLKHADARDAVDGFREGVARGPRYQAEIRRWLSLLNEQGYVLPEGQRWDTPSEIRQSFAKQARRALDAIDTGHGKSMPVGGKRGALAKAMLSGKALLSVQARAIKRDVPQLVANRDARNLALAEQAARRLGASETVAQGAAPAIVRMARDLRTPGAQRAPRGAPWQGNPHAAANLED